MRSTIISNYTNKQQLNNFTLAILIWNLMQYHWIHLDHRKTCKYLFPTIPTTTLVQNSFSVICIYIATVFKNSTPTPLLTSITSMIFSTSTSLFHASQHTWIKAHDPSSFHPWRSRHEYHPHFLIPRKSLNHASLYLSLKLALKNLFCNISLQASQHKQTPIHDCYSYSLDLLR